MFICTITNDNSHPGITSELPQEAIFNTIFRFRAACDWLVLLSPGSFLASDWLHLLPLGPNLLPCGLPRQCKATSLCKTNGKSTLSWEINILALSRSVSSVYNSCPIVISHATMMPCLVQAVNRWCLWQMAEHNHHFAVIDSRPLYDCHVMQLWNGRKKLKIGLSR